MNRLNRMRALVVLSFLSLLSGAASCGGTGEAPATSGLKPVPHEKLLELLPTLPGWTRGTPQGETDTSENVSRVQVNYEQDGGMGGLSIEIMDTTANADILGPLLEFIKANQSETSSDGTATSITPVQVLGFPGKQEWTPFEGANNGSLGILVAGRFTVGITGNSLMGADVMTKAAEAIDLKRLAALR